MSSKSHKKVLLMGKSGSGKTSMRAIIFRSQSAADTRRLGATVDLENTTFKLLGGLRLDLWDCGGQDAFMNSHLTSQASHVFRSVHTLIYIFDAESPDLYTSDMHYFLNCLGALIDHNPIAGDSGPTLFVLLHKMDLVPPQHQETKLRDFSTELQKKIDQKGWKGQAQFYGTSIWNESLYKAWSLVIANLMPSLSSVKSQLSSFRKLIGAREIVLFEKTTFLVIATDTETTNTEDVEKRWVKDRFERISNIVKSFKLGCSKIRAPFVSFATTTPSFTAVLDILTPDTYVLVVADSSMEPAAIELNIKYARPHFEQLDSMRLSR